jgi:hypothetical protein
MNKVRYVAQPAVCTTLDAIAAIAKTGDLTQLDVAVAYVTSSGTYDLFKRIDAAIAAHWAGVKKNGGLPPLTIAVPKLSR